MIWSCVEAPLASFVVIRIENNNAAHALDMGDDIPPEKRGCRIAMHEDNRIALTDVYKGHLRIADLNGFTQVRICRRKRFGRLGRWQNGFAWYLYFP